MLYDPYKFCSTEEMTKTSLDVNRKDVDLILSIYGHGVITKIINNVISNVATHIRSTKPKPNDLDAWQWLGSFVGRPSPQLNLGGHVQNDLGRTPSTPSQPACTQHHERGNDLRPNQGPRKQTQKGKGRKPSGRRKSDGPAGSVTPPVEPPWTEASGGPLR